jgi:hypothetical protein
MIRAQRGQAATEYILLLAIMMGLIILLMKQIIRPGFERIKAVMTERLEGQLFPGGKAFHQYRLRR